MRLVFPELRPVSVLVKILLLIRHGWVDVAVVVQFLRQLELVLYYEDDYQRPRHKQRKEDTGEKIDFRIAIVPPLTKVFVAEENQYDTGHPVDYKHKQFHIIVFLFRNYLL